MLFGFVSLCFLCTADCAMSFGGLESVKPAYFELAKIPKASIVPLDFENGRSNEAKSEKNTQRIKTEIAEPNIRRENETLRQESEPVKSSTIQTSESHIQSDQQHNPKTSLAENEVPIGRNLFNQLIRHKTATPMSSMAGQAERHNVLTDSVTSTSKLKQQTVTFGSHEKPKNKQEKYMPKSTTNTVATLLSPNETKDIYRKLDQLNMTFNKKSEEFSKQIDKLKVIVKSKKGGKKPISAKTVQPRLSHSSLRKSTKKQHVEDRRNEEQKTTNVYNATECPRNQSVMHGEVLELKDRNISATAQYKCLQGFQACREQLTCEANGLWNTDGACMSAQTEWDSPKKTIYDIPCNFTYGTTISILGTPIKNPGLRTTFTFCYVRVRTNRDILLHVSANVERKKIRRFSFLDNTFLKRERDYGKDYFHIDEEFNLTIVYGKDEYKAYVDGEHVFDYEHQTKIFPEIFGIYGDLKIRKIRFSM